MISNSETNTRLALPSSTTSLNRSGFITSSGLHLISPPRGERAVEAGHAFDEGDSQLRILAVNIRTSNPPCLGELRLQSSIGRLV